MSDKLARIGGTTTNTLTPTSYTEARAVCADLAKARGFVPDTFVGNPGAILAALMTGAELGIGPMQAMRSIHIVKGRPVLAADLMLALALRAGVRQTWLETSNEVARIKLQRAGHDPFTMAFTIEDAKRAGLGGDNWKKYPAAMLRARCLSASLKAFCPDVLGAGVYVEGEIVDDEPPQRRQPEPVAAANDYGPEPDVIDHDPETAPRKRLETVADAAELEVWCRTEGQVLLDGYPAEKVEAGVLEHAAKIGVERADVMLWLHGEDAA